MSLNWFISNIHSVQWNPTQQLKMHYAKLKKKQIQRPHAIWFHFQHSEKAKVQGQKTKSMVAKYWKQREELTTRGSGMGGACVVVNKDHRHPSKLKGYTLTRKKFTVCKWQLFKKKSCPHSIKTEHKDKKYKVMICFHSVLYKYKHHC